MSNYSVNNETLGEKTSTSFWYGFQRFILFIVIVTVIGTAIGCCIAAVKNKTVYTAKESIMIIFTVDDEKQNGVNASAIKKVFLTSVSDKIKESPCVAKANDKYKEVNADASPKAISAGAIKVGVKEDSLIITVSYSDLSEKAAKEKLDAVIFAASEILPEQYAVKNLTISPLQNKPEISTSDSFWKFVLIGSGAGLLLSFVASVIIKSFDQSIRSKKELEEITGVGMLSYIEDFKS